LSEQNVRSSWITDIVGDKYLNRLQQQATVFKIDDKKMVPGRSQSFIGKEQVMLSSRNGTILSNGHLKDVKQQGVSTKVPINKGSIVFYISWSPKKNESSYSFMASAFSTSKDQKNKSAARAMQRNVSWLLIPFLFLNRLKIVPLVPLK
jgi:hypothetical protein